MPAQKQNRFVETLRTQTGWDLAAECEPVDLPFKLTLFDMATQPRHVHFVTSGVASVVNTMRSGSAVEVWMSGFEGFPETNQLLGPLVAPKRCMMQVGGSALRMPFERFRQRFQEDKATRELALRLIQYEVLASNQLTACNGLHEVEDRLARWMLMVQDRIESPDLPLAQEFLADMLGTRRATVTLAAANLQRAGLIEYRRGNIRIVDRMGLEDVTCECYATLARLRRELYA